ncbi:MAG: caspase family protein [Deltaproteobacteria bacterium]|nr:caspase family protein [Deltaproteobacteria bacterium]
MRVNLKKCLPLIIALLTITVCTDAFEAAANTTALTNTRIVSKTINKAIHTNTRQAVKAMISSQQSRQGRKTPVSRIANGTKQTRTAKPTFTISSPACSAPTVLAITPDGRYMASGNENGDVQIWNLETGQRLFNLEAKSGAVRALTATAGNNFFAAGYNNGRVILWNLKNGKKERDFTAHTQEIVELATLEGGLLISAGADNKIKIWESNGELIREFSVALLSGMALNQAQTIIISSSLDGNINTWEMTTGKLIKTMNAGHAVLTLATTGNNLVAAGLENGEVQVWNSVTGRRIMKQKSHQAAVRTVAFSPDNTILASAGDNQQIFIWSPRNQARIATLSGHEAEVKNLGFSSDGHFIFSAGADRMIRVWERNYKTEIARLISLGSGWAVVSPTGSFDGSLNGSDSERVAALKWSTGKDNYSLEAFLNGYYTPALLGYLLTGSTISEINPNETLAGGFLPPPQIEIKTSNTAKESPERTIKVTVVAHDMGGGVNEIRLFHNGKIAGEKLNPPENAGAAASFTNTWQLNLLPGKNQIQAIATNTAMIEGHPAEITVTFAGKKEKRTLHVVTVGINEYENPRLNLSFAGSDAKSVGDYFEKTYRTTFDEIKIYRLFNQQATRTNINRTLNLLTDSSPQDTVLIYLAGHGETFDENWYFIPHEVRHPENNKVLTQEALSSSLLQLSAVKFGAQKIFLLLDSCKSGAALNVFDDFNLRRPLALLSQNTGIHVAAASSSLQTAGELGRLGHGLFTYSLLEGLKGKADLEPIDKTITALEIMHYICTELPLLSNQYQLPQQDPAINSRGNNFPICKRSL